MKDPSKNYRNAALSYASGFADKELYIELMKMVPKAKPELKIDILNWIGREAKKSAKHDIIQNLEIRFGIFLPSRSCWSSSVMLTLTKQAATGTLVKIGDKSYIPSLAELLKSEQVVLPGGVCRFFPIAAVLSLANVQQDCSAHARPVANINGRS